MQRATLSALPRWLGLSWRSAATLAVALGGVVFLFWSLSDAARQELDALATASSDNSEWSLSQAEVELLALQLELERSFAEPGSDLSQARLRFDVFYSRAVTLRSAPLMSNIRATPQGAEAVAGIERFLAEATPFFDADDATLRQSGPAVLPLIADVRQALRKFAIAGLQVFSQNSSRQRAQVSTALAELAVLASLLFVVLLAIVALLLRYIELNRRRSAEAEQVQSRLHSVVASSFDAIIIARDDDQIVSFNPAATRMFGFRSEEAVGQQISDLLVPQGGRATWHNQLKNHMRMRRDQDDGILMQLELIDKRSTPFPVELTVTTAENEEGALLIYFVRDISHQLEAERALIEARDRARAGEQAKAQMLAVMSHEMRTPLNGVIGTMQLLSGTQLDKRQRGFLDVMRSSGQMLLRQVNSVLDISRMDSGKTETTQSDFDLAALIEDVVNGLQASAGDQGNRIAADLSGLQQVRVSGDGPRITQILVNLVGNAIKFTANGTVTVSAASLDDDGLVEIRVRDTGCGIAPEDQAQIFDEFVTLDSSYARQKDGSGLGLAIVRRMVDLLGGRLGVESQVGQGATFWVRLTLPAATTLPSERSGVPEPVVLPRQRPTGAQKSVLLVEDNEFNRIVACEMLELAGAQVTQAAHGRAGVDAAEAQAFDLILMDISMPVLDGITAAALIMDGAGPNRNTPIVAVTAHALPQDVERFRAAGMADVLIKPIDQAHLLTMLASHAHVPRNRSAELRETAWDAGEDIEEDPVFDKGIAELRAGFKELSDLAANGDHLALAARAHALCGTAAVLRFARLRTILAEAEDGAKRKDDASLAEILDKYRASLADLGMG